MPLYEYFCRRCGRKFELLRPMSRMDDPATCPQGHKGGQRVLSSFAALTKSADGSVSSVGGSPCAACAGGTCSTCGVR